MADGAGVQPRAGLLQFHHPKGSVTSRASWRPLHPLGEGPWTSSWSQLRGVHGVNPSFAFPGPAGPGSPSAPRPPAVPGAASPRGAGSGAPGLVLPLALPWGLSLLGGLQQGHGQVPCECGKKPCIAPRGFSWGCQRAPLRAVPPAREPGHIQPLQQRLLLIIALCWWRAIYY